MSANPKHSLHLEENVAEQSKLLFAGDALKGVKLLASGSADFLSSMTMSDLFNAWVTTDAHNNGIALPGMPLNKLGITEQQNGDFFAAAVVAANFWGVFGIVTLSMFFVANLYVTMHTRLAAHHEAVVALHKCYGVLSRIELFLKSTALYSIRYNFQIDSIEIQEDLVRVFKLLDEIATKADIRDVYNNITQGYAFKLEKIDGVIVPVQVDIVVNNPGMVNRIKRFGRRVADGFKNFGRGVARVSQEVFEGIHRITKNISGWSARFESIMIELNSHFTLLVGEFFMLANLHQLQHGPDFNKDFADTLLNDMTSNNPVWCIKLQIMLAPLLRARIVLVSCALSTNTSLCRETINAEMKELDNAKGLEAMRAYLKKLYRRYKTGMKQIDPKLFIKMMASAVSLVERSKYYSDILSSQSGEYSNIIRHIDSIKTNLVDPVSQEKLDAILKILNEINKIAMSCGNSNEHGTQLKPFQQEQYNSSLSMIQSHADITPVYEQQAISYSRNLPSSGSGIDDIQTYIDILNGLCGELMDTARSNDSLAYDVASHFRESCEQTEARVRMTYQSSSRAAEVEELVLTQCRYNELYMYVTSFDPTTSRASSISEERGREMAACILLMECIRRDAIMVPNIRAICDKCQTLMSHITARDRTATAASILFVTGSSQDENRISSVIARVIDRAQGVRQSGRRPTGRQQPRVGPAMPAIDEEFELQEMPSRAGPELTLRPRAGSEGIELTSESPPSQVMSDNDSDNEASGAGIAHLLKKVKGSKSSSGAAAKGKSKGKSKEGGKTRKPMLRTRRRHKKQIQVTRNKKQTRNLKVKNKRRYTRRHS